MQNSVLTEVGKEMNVQDNRSTQLPIFVVVEDKKIYGMDPDSASGRTRIDDVRMYSSQEGGDLCEACDKRYFRVGSAKEDCDDCPDYTFVWYRIEMHVPNMRAGFFFTAEACDAHIDANPHHYDRTARSYAFSAYHNTELRSVLRALSEMGSEDGKPKDFYV